MCICKYVCMCVYVCMYMHMYVCRYICIYIYIYMLAPPPMIHRSVVRGVVEGEQDLSGMHAISTPSTFYSAYSFRSISFQSSRERTKTRFIQRYIWWKYSGLAANFGTLGNQDDSAGLNSENMAKYPPSVVENPLSSTHTSFAIDALVIKIV